MTYRMENPQAEDLTWISLLDEAGQPQISVGLAANELQTRVRHVDGWRTGWCTAAVDRQTAAQLGLPMEAIGGRNVVGLPIPFVLLSIPDYPDPEGVTLAIPVLDLERMLLDIHQVAAEAKRQSGKQVRRAVRELKQHEHDVAARIKIATRCSVNGCHRERHFFDEKGQGYCKKHAEERGIRPKGKVV